MAGYEEWPQELIDILDNGVRMLRIPRRLVHRLEKAGILTIKDLRRQTVTRLRRIVPLGWASQERLLSSLHRKGFRSRPGHVFNPDEPLCKLFDHWVPVEDDPMDLLAETLAVDQNLELLGYMEAMERAVSQLKDVQTHFPPESTEHKMLEWVIYYTSMRLLEPPEEE